VVQEVSKHDLFVVSPRFNSSSVKITSWDWHKCLSREIEPPFVPGFKSPDDTSNFDKYDDDPPTLPQQLSEEEMKLFDDF